VVSPDWSQTSYCPHSLALTPDGPEVLTLP
jgi:hypothetical protein